MPPVLVQLPLADGLPARLLDVRLRLAPREDEIRLVVEPLLAIDGIGRRVFAAPVLRIAQALQMEIDPLVPDRNGLKVAH